MNTVPPNDYTYFEMPNDLVQAEPAVVIDPELMGPIAAIGIVKGEPFAPDERMKKILTEAVALANATSRTLGFEPEYAGVYYYEGSRESSPSRVPIPTPARLATSSKATLAPCSTNTSSAAASVTA